MAETFNPREYDRLLKKSTAEAEAYRLRTQTPAVAPVPDIGARQTAQKDRAALQAAEVSAAQKAIDEASRKGVEEYHRNVANYGIPGSAIEEMYGPPPNYSDLARAAQKAAPVAPEPSGNASDLARAAQKAAPVAVEPTKVAESAKVLAGAEPSKVGAVLDKLKEEEAKGGPDFWDVVQAAAAGWGGQVPLYVQKELKRKEAETQLSQAETIAQRQAEIAKAERGEEQAFQRELTEKQLANALKIAGIKAPGQVGGLSLQEFTGIK